MHVFNFLLWLQGTWFSHLVSKSNHLVGAGLQIVHILGFVLMLAALLLVSLRLVGAILTDRPIEDIACDGIRLLWSGFGFAIGSGVMMFSASPLLYFPNKAFRWKMAFLVLAVLLQLTLYRALLRRPSRSPVLLRAGVAVTAVAWLGIALAGRMIGFI